MGLLGGAHRSVLLQVDHALLRSVLDYESIVHGSASPSTLQALDMNHHAGMRFSIGASHTSHFDCLLIDTLSVN